MDGTIRPATREDVPAILNIAEAKRAEYQRYQRTFWRKAGDSREKHGRFLETLVVSPDVIFRVHQTGESVDGFAIGSLMSAPPVYDPGGPVCLIDDFAFSTATAWADVGARLLEAVTAEAKARGAVLAAVICGHRDTPKRAMLAQAGYEVASEWHTRDL